MVKPMEKHEWFWKYSFNYTPRRSVSLLTLAYGQYYFSNCNNRWMTFTHAGIFLSLMQRIDEYLLAFKDFDYSCSLGCKRPNTSKGK